MKILLTLLATLSLGVTLFAQDKHDHAHDHPETKAQAGPNGGRLLTTVEPHAEFFVMPDRKVQISFFDKEGKPVAAAEQVVTVTTGERSAPVKLVFEKSGELLVSTEPVPEGGTFPLVVQIKVTPDAKTVVEKFNLNLAICPGCGLAEYACICAHAH